MEYRQSTKDAKASTKEVRRSLSSHHFPNGGPNTVKRVLGSEGACQSSLIEPRVESLADSAINAVLGIDSAISQLSLNERVAENEAAAE